MRHLGYHTAAWVFDDPAVLAEVDGRFCLTDTPKRLMGLYGLRDGRVATFAVHREPDPALPADPLARLREVYADMGWVVPAAVAALPEQRHVYYDQVAQIQVPRWSRGRVVLLGDACQAVSLLAGQGASLAVAGAYLLGEQLAVADSVEQALEEYEAAWRPLVENRQHVGRRTADWFVPPSRARVWLRRTAMRATRLPARTRLLAGALVGGVDQRAGAAVASRDQAPFAVRGGSVQSRAE